jgi:hypothetical protein
MKTCGEVNSLESLKEINNLGGLDANVRIIPARTIEVQQFQDRVQ